VPDVARTRTSAVKDLGRALSRYELGVGSVHNGLTRRLSAIAEHATMECMSRRRQLEDALAELEDCQGSPGGEYSVLVAAVARARLRLDNADRALRLIAQAGTDLSLATARLSREIADGVRDGTVLVTAALADLEAYLSNSVGAPGGSAGGADRHLPPPRLTQIGTTPTAESTALNNVPLAHTDTSAPPLEPGDLERGYTPEDLKWAINALHEVVLPALAAGKGTDYFRTRDLSEGRHGYRSYSTTFSAYLADDLFATTPPATVTE
jgi:hypothetical protein